MKPYVPVSTALSLLPSLDVGERDESYPNHVVPRIQKETVERIENTDEGEPLWDSYETNRRLDGDEPAPTIIGKDWKYAHPTEDRPLTVRERATLQSFPDDYEFHGNRAEQRQQTADSVPPKLAESIAEVLQP